MNNIFYLSNNTCFLLNVVHAVFLSRVPDEQDVAFGELRQGDLCLDTMGHLGGGTVKTNKCHGHAGNQVSK